MSSSANTATASSPVASLDPHRDFTPSQALVLGCLALIGTAASIGLIMAEIAHYRNPSDQLSCDLNPLVGCSESIAAWQSHLLILPNSVLGVVAFSALLGLCLAWLTGASLPQWFWGLAGCGGLSGLALVGFFLVESVTVFKALCPFCLVVWMVSLPISIILIARSARILTVVPRSLSNFVWGQRWIIVLALYLLVVLVIAIGFGTRLALLF